MDSEKQIEEMARIIAKANGNEQNVAYYRPDATDLYNAGYCKASDVAREVIDDCIDILNTEYRKCDTNDVKIILAMVNAIAELKKKYIGEDTNVPTKMEDR